MDRNILAVKQAIKFLRKSAGTPKILVKQIRNLGDTLHLTPVIHHYRLKFPSAAIAFVVGQWYHNIHEYNPHINSLFLADHNADPQQRLKLWAAVMNARDIDIKIIASIFPFGEIHPQNRWCHTNIADQYLHNAGITDLKPLGGRQLIARTTKEDRAFAENICEKHKTRRLVVLEYVSYSKEPVWKFGMFRQLAETLRKKGVRCVSIASSTEPLVPGTIDCRGVTWRQTAAILGVSKAMVGVGSGITMIAAAAEPQPRIIELGIPPSVSMKGCGYAPSVSMDRPTMDKVVRSIMEVT